MLTVTRICICCVLLLLTGSCLPLNNEISASRVVLVIQNSQTEIRYELPIDDLEILTIRFFHSFDRQWVEESFRIENGHFVPTEVSFKDDSYDYRHQRYRCRQIFERQQFRLLDIEPLPSDKLQIINTRVAYTRAQLLVFKSVSGKHLYSFTEWGQPGQRLTFSVRK